MKLKLKKLKPEEADLICWEESYYMDNIRKDRQRAARYAWKQACKAFPRLKQFERLVP